MERSLQKAGLVNDLGLFFLTLKTTIFRRLIAFLRYATRYSQPID